MRVRLAARAICLTAALMLPLRLVPAEPEPAPLPTDVVEHAERRLVQLDVSLKPKKQTREGGGELPLLDPDDFELVVAGDRYPIVHADRLCSMKNATTTEPAPAPDSTAAPAPPAEVTAAELRRGVYVFYIEHSHLTMQGQENALSMAAEMIPRLITGGTRGMVVSSGNQWLQSPMSEDPAPLLEMIASVRKNTRQWTSVDYAELEEKRLIEIDDALKVGQIDRARTLIRRYQQDEISITTNRLRRLSALLGALADLDPPRSVLYFADIIRKNAGEHYKSMLATDEGDKQQLGSTFSADFAFDGVTEQSGALGIRLYTVQARGFHHDSVGSGGPIGRQQGQGSPVPRGGMKDARSTLEGLALETGGASFFGGTDRKSIEKVLDKIHDDLSCFYLLSFEPKGLGEDNPLPVRVRFNVDSPRFAELDAAYDVATRGQIVVQSAAARRESQLLAAHVAENAEAEAGARGALIPLAWRDGAYDALAQLMVANPDLPPELTADIAWDMGMTHEFRNEVANQVSGHVKVAEPGIPVVLEAIWRFKPGPSRVVAVAHESRFGQVASSHQDWEWPDPDEESASISPIAVVQPMRGAFLRKGEQGDETRREGSLGVGDGAALVDRQTYLISLVCRSKRMNRDLWIERKLVGAAPVEFGLQRWEGGVGDDDRCVQLRDLVGEGQMGWGAFKYEISVFESEKAEGDPLAQREIEFAALEPGQNLDDLEEQEPQAPRARDPLALNSGSAD